MRLLVVIANIIFLVKMNTLLPGLVGRVLMAEDIKERKHACYLQGHKGACMATPYIF